MNGRGGPGPWLRGWTLAAAGFLALAAPVLADDLVRVYLDDGPSSLRTVLASGFRTILHRRGQFIDVVVPAGRLDDLAPCRHRILQRSFDRAMAALARRPDRGAYSTDAELLATMEGWVRRFPGQVRLETVGTTWDTRRGLADRPLRMAVVGTPAPGRPVVLLVGGIHAREVGTVEVVLGVVERLLSSGARDRTTAALLGRVVLLVLPCLNPDGRQVVFDGNLWWRKNCRPGPDGAVVGVDLNRNFDHRFGADGPQGGSSASPGTEIYRGPHPFSEPESDAVRSLVDAWPDLVASLSVHSYGRLLLVPFGHDGRWPSHARLYREIAADMVRDAPWAVGTVHELLGYYSNGRHDDWLYGTVGGGKDRVLAFQAEVGDSFFPDETALPGLADEAEPLVRNLLRRVATPPVVAVLVSPPGADGTVNAAVTVANRSLGPLDDLGVELLTTAGRVVPVREELSLSGSLRGGGPSSVTTIVALTEAEAASLLTARLVWRGGEATRVIDPTAPRNRRLAED